MDDFDFGDWLGDIESGLDLSGGDTSWLDTVDWGSMIDSLDFSDLDLSDVYGDISAGGLGGPEDIVITGTRPTDLSGFDLETADEVYRGSDLGTGLSYYPGEGYGTGTPGGMLGAEDLIGYSGSGNIFGWEDPYEVDGRQGSRDEDTTEEDLKDKFWKDLINKNDTNIVDKIIKNLIGGGGGNNAALIAALLGGLAGLLGRGGTSQPQGYQGGIPKYIATRGPARSPTEGGRRPGGANIGSLTGGVTYTPTGQMLSIPGAAQGGLMGLATGGKARPARYLAGGTDGMADKIQTDIDGKQPARLSHGEFVIPADVVSHLGNGNSDAGANVLYDMMAKVRRARTGTEKQGRQINPHKYIPGGGR